MAKMTIWTLILALAFTNAAGAATDEAKCQKKKLLALGKRHLCVQKERGKEVLGKTPNVATCAAKFDKRIAAAEKKTPCRWLDNGDGTATDLNSGLQWELKTDDGSIHDKDNLYTWSATGTAPDGTAFVDFLGALNGGESSDGQTTTGCFASTCDWRFPTIEELQGIIDFSAPGCFSGSPCTTIPGETDSLYYWSSSSDAGDPLLAWAILFDGGFELDGDKDDDALRVHAVRGGP